MERTVEKEYKWEMAHRLLGKDSLGLPVPYCDNCRHLHGHSYKARVKVLLQSDETLDQYGMVLDYNKMKALKKWIDDRLDHCVMISSYDKDLINFIDTQDGRDKHFIIDSPSTAENIAELIYNQAVELFDNPRIHILEVKVNETSTSEATYHA